MKMANSVSTSLKSAKILQFSYVGMEPQEVKIGNQKELNISLTPHAKNNRKLLWWVMVRRKNKL